jgi:hypothetical protein
VELYRQERGDEQKNSEKISPNIAFLTTNPEWKFEDLIHQTRITTMLK